MKSRFLRFPGTVVIGLFLFACTRPAEEPPRIALEEGVTLPAVTALAWLVSGDTSNENFASLDENGVLRVWNIYSGLMSISGVAPEFSGTGIPDVPGFTLENSTAFPGPAASLASSDGTKMILPAGDGGVVLADARTGETLARYYGFGSVEASEWVGFVPGGFYTASLFGDRYLAASGEISRDGTRRFFGRRPPGEIRKYRLDQLSGALFRPDLFRVSLRENEAGDETADKPFPLKSLFSEEEIPPLLSISSGGSGASPGLRVTVAGGKVGHIAFYRRSGDVDIPSGLFTAEKLAAGKFSEDGITGYEITLPPGFWPAAGNPAEIGISVFNESNTIESGRQWIQHPGGASGTVFESSRPALKLLLASSEDGGDIRELEEFFSLQEEGSLYSAVTVRRVFGGEFGRAGFMRAASELLAKKNDGDVVVICLKGSAGADSNGDLLIFPEKGGTEENPISAFDVLGQALDLSGASLLILLDLKSDLPREKMESALLRFRQRLGPGGLLALCENDGTFPSLIPPALERLNPLSPEAGGANISGEPRYIMSSDFFAAAVKVFGERGTVSDTGLLLAFPPPEDFRFADPLVNMGEIRFQTMTSGTLKVDQVDREPVPLVFGNTMIRTFPPGSYIIDMIYRNGYRETRFVNLRKGESVWVVFTYTPALLTGNFSGALPANGINIAELNPANYEKINREAMEGMGMAPYYVAYLAGEKLYKEDNYDRAIAEFSRAISLKADYADAYVSRGNARRKKGELDSAIADYSRALELKKGYAEVFNYRGFVYAQKNDFVRAAEDYSRAIQYRADYADAYFNRAYARAKLGDWDRAIADYGQVIKLEPSNGIAYNERGNAWKNKGDNAKAALDYAEAEKLKNH